MLANKQPFCNKEILYPNYKLLIVKPIKMIDATENKKIEHMAKSKDDDWEFSFSWHKVRGYFSVFLATFLLIVVPIWWYSGEVALQRDSAQRELRLSQMQNTLATSVIEAQRGEYEPARQTLNEFFKMLQTQLEEQDTGLIQIQRENLKPLLAQRDELLESLGRSDPAAAERLQKLFMSYHKAINNTSKQDS